MTIDGDTIKWLKDRFKKRVKFDEIMAKHTSLKVGGPADAFIMARSISEVKDLIKFAFKRKIPYLLVGGGSNLLVKDVGIKGMVISLSPFYDSITVEQRDEKGAVVLACAGARTQRLCRFAMEKGLGGFNFALGIPGTIGGAVMMNAGTYMGSMSDVLNAISIMLPSGDIKRIEKEDLRFSYRHLSIKGREDEEDRDSVILLSAYLYLSSLDTNSIKKESKMLIRQRKGKQPTAHSAGCFFKNPGFDKSAGELIELAGLKGKRVGDAQVSSKHGNFIVNRGNARAKDVLQLMTHIQETILDQFNLKLEPEVIILGR